MTILNPRIENGEFKGILFDKYDYKWLSKEELPNLETRKLNNSAYTLQTINKLTNYYVIIPVHHGFYFHIIQSGEYNEFQNTSCAKYKF